MVRRTGSRSSDPAREKALRRGPDPIIAQPVQYGIDLGKQFGNWGETNNTTGFLYFDRSVLDFGKDFQIKLGSDAIFNGKIMGLEASFPEGQAPEIRVLAEDRFQDLRMTRRTRWFDSSGERKPPPATGQSTGTGHRSNRATSR